MDLGRRSTVVVLSHLVRLARIVADRAAELIEPGRAEAPYTLTL